MSRIRVTVLAVAFSVGALMGHATITDEAKASVPFTQAEFPCQEDEVLGYAPEFGPDNVGCIHIDLLKR
ncbi:hypothetical protein PBI_EQUEMIOH13_86 [Mycobacterium phage Equemioh13]|uniref:Uncharacterized protein n=1 Tax=Mycobacterium phage Centaur TaxID=2488784 RepID=A0A3G8FI15_9CAUD|nr:hypothetical protein AVT12_gp20 [Mycobacterium phage Equemioh13]YP_010063701.1 hypothetical protein KIY82_gp21 [Mycobacterium phage Centaur]AMB18577.1 hypothetical protein NASIATALIE_87 [Mycobacterium phage NaSiaTalie]ATN92273.1 hypothetical protein SEA_UPDAWG_87 [Mycobacterium phage Updawg]AYD86361.1 hypothetical protein SEA_FLARE16_86 [Mycobacterium phage Flare16]QDM57288.1 hypothetical protein SEA_WIDEWALE_87 [Mycobacterium phage WideWale]QXN74115.1 membrane protein [Mycobacterium Phage